MHKHFPSRSSRGFILPVVIILSVALSIVSVTALRTVSNSSVTLNNQYYSQLAQEAAQAGANMAVSCIKQGTITWPNPLKPHTNCSGVAGAGLDYVSKDNNWKTTFEVATPTTVGSTTTITAIGTMSLTTSSGITIGQTITKNVKASVTVTPGTSSTADNEISGGRHGCVVANGQAYCWGYGYYGQQGNGSNAANMVPIAVSTAGVLAGKTVTAISAAERHTCAIADGKAYCWGYGYYGQQGNGSNASNMVPVAVSTAGVLAGKTVTDISTGFKHTCAIADGQAYCWGYGYYGQQGNGSNASNMVPVAVTASGALAGKTVTSINAGERHTCAIADGKAYCWGYGYYGQQGIGSNATNMVPVAVSTSGVLAGKTVTNISAGYRHTCAVADGKAYCWGYGYYGQQGNGSNATNMLPVAVTASGVLAGKTVTNISAGSRHSCAVASGQAYCWGYGYYGQQGNGSNATNMVPVAVTASGVLAGKTVTAISAALFDGIDDDTYEDDGRHTCAIASGQAYCWGYGYYGQQGNGSNASNMVPVAVSTAGVLAGKTVNDGSTSTPSIYSVVHY
jgi:alpha-tubulin suppressor-like RCC1 family protein